MENHPFQPKMTHLGNSSSAGNVLKSDRCEKHKQKKGVVFDLTGTKERIAWR
jgi:hypothetical protein